MEVAVVGGGVGGMISALLLARRGVKVTLYEKKGELGGRLAFERSGEYRIDRGPTIVLLPETLVAVLGEAGISEEEYELIPCHPMYRIHYEDGSVLTKWSDEEQMAEELDRFAPGESAAFRRYMKDMAPAFHEGKSSFLERPFLKLRSFFTWRNVRLLARLRVYLSARGMAGRYFKSSKVIDAFSLQTLYIGGLPTGSPSLYTFIPYAEHAYGIWYMKGGYASLVQVLAAALQREGVAIRTGVQGEVAEIATDGDSVLGIKTKDGSFLPHDKVIYNGDFPHLAAMLPDRKPRKERKFVPSSGCILIYLGTNKRWTGEYEPQSDSSEGRTSAHQFFLPDDLPASLERMALSGRLPGGEDPLPAYYLFNPCELDEQAAPDGHSALYVLIPVPIAAGAEQSPENWLRDVHDLADRVLEDAERRAYPGLRESIVWKHIRTPMDGAEEGWYQGGSFGIAPTLLQSGAFRPQFSGSGINGLYSVGASIHPGGGIPIVMLGARMLADHILEEWDDGEPSEFGT
ncbi:phytoene desaturase family protein [Paenibacillus sp. GCM10023252]|uniref:phytoene desaturase family protein n=1 Tax=Paenibacillus sp. GCM10023252 TaxID=3252649 RepID=UPI00360C1747